MLKGNKGEWSEIYVLLKLLAEGKLYAADKDMKKSEYIFFPILKIIREENKEEKKEYSFSEKENVEIYINGIKQKKFPKEIFNREAGKLIEKLKDKKLTGSFEIRDTETFMAEIECLKLKAPSTDKADIKMKIMDINTGYTPTVGFSIKSELGSSPTLLNAGKTTNFIYLIDNEDLEAYEEETNKIYNSRGKTDVKGRISYILKNRGKIKYYEMENKNFKDNLILIDSLMDKILAETLLYFYRDGIVKCSDMIKKLEKENPFFYRNVNAYSYKLKKFLTAVALGMKPSVEWDGIDEATGGYIIVTKKGDVVAYYIYNRNFFEEYLLNNTKYETASTSRHEFGKVYRSEGNEYINLNLQIRFL